MQKGKKCQEKPWLRESSKAVLEGVMKLQEMKTRKDIQCPTYLKIELQTINGFLSFKQV